MGANERAYTRRIADTQSLSAATFALQCLSNVGSGRAFRGCNSNQRFSVLFDLTECCNSLRASVKQPLGKFLASASAGHHPPVDRFQPSASPPGLFVGKLASDHSLLDRVCWPKTASIARSPPEFTKKFPRRLTRGERGVSLIKITTSVANIPGKDQLLW